MRVDADIAKAAAMLRSITEAQQLRFAVSKALTQTAYDVQKEVRANMPKRMTIRRDWVVRSVKVEKATKAKLESVVYSDFKAMGLQEFGGQKDPRRNFIAVPTSLVKRTKTDIIKKSDRPGALGDKAEVIKFNGNYWLALKRARKGAGGNRLRLLYLLIPRAKLHERLGLRKDGERIARQKFAANLQDALEYAVRTAR